MEITAAILSNIFLTFYRFFIIFKGIWEKFNSGEASEDLNLNFNPKQITGFKIDFECKEKKIYGIEKIILT